MIYEEDVSNGAVGAVHNSPGFQPRDLCPLTPLAPCKGAAMNISHLRIAVPLQGTNLAGEIHRPQVETWGYYTRHLQCLLIHLYQKS